MQDFEGKVAVVTGGASGMGKAFAERFAAAGMKVVLADYEEPALEATVKQFEQREYDVLGVVVDVSDAAAVENVAQRTLDKYGAIHVLCNNAGVVAESDLSLIADPAEAIPVWEQPLNDWRWTFNVNWWGVVHGIRSFVPIMLEQDEPGHIVNTASIAGLVSGAALPIYGATKHAVVRVSEALHMQLRARQAPLHVSVLCPGPVETRIGLAARNRPAELSDGGAAPTADVLAQRERDWEARRAGQASAMPSLQADHVAELVFRAIEEEQFWIVTHDEYDGMIRERMEDILGRRNPEARPF